MRNLGVLELRPDRRDYDAVLATRAVLSSSADVASIGNAEIFAAINSACNEGERSPFEVLGFIAGNQEPQIIRGGEFSQAALRDLRLTMSDVERGVFDARRELHKDAVRDNQLNVDALQAVFAMGERETEIPRAESGVGSPLLDHAKRAIKRLYGFDVDVPRNAPPREYNRSAHAREVFRRMKSFFRVVAKELGDEEPWTKYLDLPYATSRESERRAQVQCRVVDATYELIKERITEIDKIKAETRTKPLRLIQAKLVASASSLLGRSGSQRAL